MDDILPQEASAIDQPGTDYGRRSDFLIEMYGQLMEDINRHIVVIWQIVGVMGAAIAALTLAESNHFSIQYAVMLVILVGIWAIDHIYDSNFWYNRNLVMITNIERVFLTAKDIDLIHPYFAKHRSTSSFLTHLKIQKDYTVIIISGVMAYYAIDKVIPSLNITSPLDLSKIVPFLAFVGFVWRIGDRSTFYNKKYANYLAISPGLVVPRNPEYKGTHGA